MGFIALKCPSCGADIEIDQTREFGYCLYCGTKIVQDKQIIEHTGSVIIDGIAGESSLLDRGYIFLEDRDFENADLYFDRVLDINPRNPRAYLGKLFCLTKVPTYGDMLNYTRSIENDELYLKAFRFAEGNEKRKIQELGAATTLNMTEIQEKISKQKQRELNAERLSKYESSKARIRRRIIIALSVSVGLGILLSSLGADEFGSIGLTIFMAIFLSFALAFVSVSITLLVSISDIKTINQLKQFVFIGDEYTPIYKNN